MRIYITSVLVDDQEKALRFYTDVLGFVKKTEFPVGEHRWLTVVSPEDPNGVGDMRLDGVRLSLRARLDPTLLVADRPQRRRQEVRECFRVVRRRAAVEDQRRGSVANLPRDERAPLHGHRKLHFTIVFLLQSGERWFTVG